ncbi:MAG: hypothetical protein RJA70_4358 [Pseudomonadota bacterium]|jgi:hypothetical protein
MTLKSILEPTIENGTFTIDAARKLAQLDWRSLLENLPTEVRSEAESLFYFIEGYVEEVDEGFVDQADDPELYERTKQILTRLRAV